MKFMKVNKSSVMLAVLFIAICTAGAWFFFCSARGAKEVRNVLLISIDTCRADHLGCYGYHRDTSPQIDSFAAEAVVFDWAFSQAPNTPPSQATILSGLYPSSHGMIGDDDRLPETSSRASPLLQVCLTVVGAPCRRERILYLSCFFCRLPDQFHMPEFKFITTDQTGLPVATRPAYQTTG